MTDILRLLDLLSKVLMSLLIWMLVFLYKHNVKELEIVKKEVFNLKQKVNRLEPKVIKRGDYL